MSIVLRLEGKAWKNYETTETSAQTKKLYTWFLRGFMKYCEIADPDLLLQIGTIHQIEDKVIEWLESLKEAGKATASMRTALASVVFFYSVNRIKLDGKFVARKIPKKPTLPHRSPTKEELATIIETTNIRGKAIAGLLASTGIRIGAIPPLKLRHQRLVKPEEIEHHDCNCKDRTNPLDFNGYVLNVYEGEEEQYFTFISEEARKWLDTYHNLRRNAGEELSANSPIIRDEFDMDNSESVNTPYVCSVGALKTFMARAGFVSGIRPNLNAREKKKYKSALRHEWKNVHGYRMFFSTAATNAGVSFSFKELMLGHHLNLEKSYYDSNNPRSVHAALAEYLKMQDAVTIFSTSKLVRENEALRRRASEVEDLKAANERLKELSVGLSFKFETQAKELEAIKKKLNL